MAVGGDVPDRVLAGSHAADVGVQRHGLRRAVAIGRCEAQKFGAAHAVGRVLADAFLERVAESLVDSGQLLRLVAGVQMGSASCREKGCQCGSHSVVAVSLETNKIKK